MLTCIELNVERFKILHSTVEGAEGTALGLVKNLLLQQNLHTRIVTCRHETLTMSLHLEVLNQGSKNMCPDYITLHVI